MDTLEIDGTTYQKVSAAARDTGYTTDYIGQMCRGGKINAKLIGRTWYIERDALGGHKKSKVRSNVAKTKESLIAELAVHSESARAVSVPMHPPYMPEYRKRLLAADVRYEQDTGILLPHTGHAYQGAITEKTHTVPVQKSIDIFSEEEAHTEANVSEKKLEDIKWNGTIVVSEIEQDAEPVSPSGEISNKESFSIEETIEVSPIHVDRVQGASSTRDISGETQYHRADRHHKRNTPAHIHLQTLGYSRMPMVLAAVTTLCAAFTLVTFMQGEWVYESSTVTRDAHYTTAYNVTSVSQIAGLINGI